MREIKFRGKKVESGLWTTGYLVRCSGRAWILHPEEIATSYRKEEIFGKTEEWKAIILPRVFVVEVIPETIGQFTGLYDIDKIEIYEGDIIDTGYDKWIVKFGNGSFYATIPNTSFFLDLSREIINYYEIKVIGNIYDNPELIEELSKK